MQKIIRIIPVIPSYEPDENLTFICRELKAAGFEDAVVVDDGSGEAYRSIFDGIEKETGFKVFVHAVNMGKGRALKNAFNLILNEYPDAPGCVTLDSDGQHKTEDIIRCVTAFCGKKDSLVLGYRDFDTEGIPWKSRFGNRLTRKAFSFLCGIKIKDTQTGLRVIPREFMEALLTVPGERFEFETNMLAEYTNYCRGGITEIPISTIYDSKDEHRTHFDPVRDSIRIYAVLLKYMLSSVLSTVIDFCVFYIATKGGVGVYGATALSRICSMGVNFALNKKAVFKADGDGSKQFLKYIILVAVSGTLSAILVKGVAYTLCISTIYVKIVVEAVLFLFNFYIQKVYIFAKERV